MHLLVEDGQEKRGYKGRLMAISGLTGHGSRVSADVVKTLKIPSGGASKGEEPNVLHNREPLIC